MEYDVFISYSSTDIDVAQKVYAYLQQKGLKPWIAPQCIPAGEPYARAITNGISKCRLMVAILSKSSNSSDNVLNEVDQAHREGKVILPFIIDNTEMCGEMRYYLSRKQWINAYPEVTTAQCEQLFKAIRVYIQPSSEEKLQSREIPNEPQEESQDVKPAKQKLETTPEPEKGKGDVAKTMMEKFPEMGLVPASSFEWQKPKKARLLSVIFFVISIVSLYFFINFLVCRYTIKWTSPTANEMKIVRCDDTVESGVSPYYYLKHLNYEEYTSQPSIGMVSGYIHISVYDKIVSVAYIHKPQVFFNRSMKGKTESEVSAKVQRAIDKEKEMEMNDCREECESGCITSLAIALPFFFFGWLFYVRYPKKGSPTLSSLASYIQEYRYKRKTRLGKKPQYVFFVKNHLFGVMNVADYRVQIPALYEKISWKEEGKLIRVTQDGHDFIIDINGEHLQ